MSRFVAGRVFEPGRTGTSSKNRAGRLPRRSEFEAAQVTVKVLIFPAPIGRKQRDNRRLPKKHIGWPAAPKKPVPSLARCGRDNGKRRRHVQKLALRNSHSSSSPAGVAARCVEPGA
jgi:hypothetical protein